MNLHIIKGNLGSDPELRTTNSGTSVANFSVATKSRRKKGDQWEEYTTWHRCVAFGKDADNISKFFSKGSEILIEGERGDSEWTDKSGNNRKTSETKVNRWHFCGSKSSNGGNSGGKSGGFSDDDVPF